MDTQESLGTGTTDDIVNQLSQLHLGPNWEIKGSCQFPRDDRSCRPSKRRSSERFGKRSSERFGRDRRNDDALDPYLKNLVVEFRPQEVALATVVRSLKDSHKTYQLFAIASLFFGKPERFFVVLSTKEEREGEKPFYYVPPNNNLFFDEKEAFDYALNANMDAYFERITEEIKRPTGNFQYVNQCGITGKLIGPPNYHQYSKLLNEHFEVALAGRYTFDTFLKSVKAVRDSDAIKQWFDSTCTTTHYRLKSDPTRTFLSRETVRRYAYDHYRHQWIHGGRHAKIAGTDIARLSNASVRKFIENALEREKSFPIGAANYLRGRLHFMGIHLYKKSRKGVAYVCAIRRKFRTEGSRFSPSIQSLIDFIDENPNVSAGELPKKFLGFEISNDGHTEMKDVLKQLQLDLHWLIEEGYVVEYDDNRLFVPAPQADNCRAS